MYIKFIFKRILYGLLVLFGVATFVFFLFNSLQGNPARMMLDQRADRETLEAIKKDLGLDQPLFTRYLLYINDLSPISVHNAENPKSLFYLSDEKYEPYTKLLSFSDSKAIVLKTPYLRRSYQTKRRVSNVIMEALPETAVLALSAITLAVLFGILFGVLSAVYYNSWLDKSSLVLGVLGMSVPSFYSGIILAWIFGYLLSEYTGLDTVGTLFVLTPFEGEVLQLQNLILPAVTLGIRPLAIIIQLTRSSMLDVLNQDYIRTARAKGLVQYKVITKHALKNALNPVLTSVSGWFASLMAGAVLVERVFHWKGIGDEVVTAVENLDLPVVMGTVLFFAVIFISINVLVDIIYGFLDPRVRIG